MIGALVHAMLAVSLAAVVRIAVPYVLGALGAALTERAGVIDLAVEAKLLVGALAAAAVTHGTGSTWLGALGGAAGGAAVGAVQAACVLALRADQVVVGIALNLAAFGGTRTVLQALYGEGANSPRVATVAGWSNPILWAGVALAALVPLALHHTRLGLRLRAVGDRPAAADAAGVSVARTRAVAVIAGGALAGLGGAQLALSVGVFSADMSGGRGYMALAAVILASWRPGRAALICLAFAFADATTYQLQVGGGQVPRELAQLLPYLWTLVVIGVVGAGRRPPGGLGR